MQVLGICRFSYPALGGFQVTHDSVAEREAFLYAPARIGERLRTFEAVTLPPLRAQTDPDFRLVILVGDSLPDPWADRLRALVADLPQAVIVTRPSGPHREVLREVINEARGPLDAGPSAQFRMDDDDAVAVDFVERLRATAQDNAHLLRDNRHFAVDFARGFIGRPGPDGLAVTPLREELATAALGVVVRARAPVTVMNFAHKKLARFMPVLRFDDSDMLIRGHNDYNDSRQKDGVKPVTLAPMDAALADERAVVVQPRTVKAEPVGGVRRGNDPAAAGRKISGQPDGAGGGAA